MRHAPASRLSATSGHGRRSNARLNRPNVDDILVQCFLGGRMQGVAASRSASNHKKMTAVGHLREWSC